MTIPGKPVGLSQTSFIFATVFVAYLVFITLRGDLAKWLAVLGFGAAPSGTSTNTNTTAPTGGTGISGLSGLNGLAGANSLNVGQGSTAEGFVAGF